MKNPNYMKGQQPCCQRFSFSRLSRTSRTRDRITSLVHSHAAATNVASYSAIRARTAVYAAAEINVASAAAMTTAVAVARRFRACGGTQRAVRRDAPVQHVLPSAHRKTHLARSRVAVQPARSAVGDDAAFSWNTPDEARLSMNGSGLHAVAPFKRRRPARHDERSDRCAWGVYP
jgi:hypothetical protein